MNCDKCKKTIDFLDNYCRYCGIELNKNSNNLKEIFCEIEQTLFANSNYSQSREEFDEYFSDFNFSERKQLTDNEYYKQIVQVIFYSGFRASIIAKKMDIIMHYFSDYETVIEYTDNDIEIMLHDKAMIKNKDKILASISNARMIKAIINQYGSINTFLIDIHNSLGLDGLRKDLIKKFKFIGEVTSYHLLTDLGFDVLKPDRVIMRIFNRLGLIDLSDESGAVDIGREMSRLVDKPIRYIDIILVSYGQLDLGEFKSICKTKNPECLLCGVNNYCKYYEMEKMSKGAV